MVKILKYFAALPEQHETIPSVSSDFAPGEVLVKFKSGVSKTQARAVIDSVGAVQIEEIQQIQLGG